MLCVCVRLFLLPRLLRGQLAAPVCDLQELRKREGEEAPLKRAGDKSGSALLQRLLLWELLGRRAPHARHYH